MPSEKEKRGAKASEFKFRAHSEKPIKRLSKTHQGELTGRSLKGEKNRICIAPGIKTVR